jgi:uncharacterized membrane protein
VDSGAFKARGTSVETLAASALSGGHWGVLAGGLQGVPRGAEAVGGGRDGALLAAVQDGQFGLYHFQKLMRTKGAKSSVFTEGDANRDRR